MKRLFAAFIFLLFIAGIRAQSEFSTPDSLARIIPKNQYDTPEALAKALCKNLKTDRDKARAIFTWIAENVRYDFKAVDREPPKNVPRKQYEAELIERTFKKGKGVCMDYSLLYKSMAEAVGLECAFIPGNSRSLVRNTLGSHAWNAVKIDGAWQLLDATWGAGFVEDGNDFNQYFQSGFFLTPPRIFATNHFPKDEKWQLLDQPIDKETFKNQPVFTYGDPERGIADVDPVGTPAARTADGKVQLRVKFRQPPSVIRLKAAGREPDFKRTEKDGWTVLDFTLANGREVQVWGGEKTKKGVHTKLLGVFPVR